MRKTDLESLPAVFIYFRDLSHFRHPALLEGENFKGETHLRSVSNALSILLSMGCANPMLRTGFYAPLQLCICKLDNVLASVNIQPCPYLLAYLSVCGDFSLQPKRIIEFWHYNPHHTLTRVQYINFFRQLQKDPYALKNI